VRLVGADEVPCFNALLDEHHFLGHCLSGRVLRYVATVSGEWVALVGFGSCWVVLASILGRACSSSWVEVYRGGKPKRSLRSFHQGMVVSSSGEPASMSTGV